MSVRQSPTSRPLSESEPGIKKLLTVEVLQPLPDAESKLEALRKRKGEKLEQLAKKIVEKTLRDKQNAAKKAAANEAKKTGGKRASGKKRKSQVMAEDGEEEEADKEKRPDAKTVADFAKEMEDAASAIEADAAKRQTELENLVAQHSAEMSKDLTHVPLMKLQTDGEKASRSVRAVLMEAAEKKANELRAQAKAAQEKILQAAEKTDAPAVVLGMPAVVQELTSMGAITKKKNKSKAPDEKDKIHENMKKLGKHLLK